MKKILLSILLTVGVVLSVMAQSHSHFGTPCYSSEYKAFKSLANPAWGEAVDATYSAAARKANQSDHNQREDELLRVPVVVHIIYNTEDENLPDEVVFSQMEVLNEDFRRLNDNADETRDEFLPVAGDANIEFYLAEVDPDGNPTNGITRTQTDVETFGLSSAFTEIIQQLVEECGIDPTDQGSFIENLPCVLGVLLGSGIDFTELTEALTGGLDGMKSEETGGRSPWPTDQYLNIWVCDLGGAILGFAYPPEGAPNWPAGSTGTPETDGVAVHYEAFGRDNPITPPAFIGIIDQGRTCVHEIGHYLGLRHVWGDGDCTEDDGLVDTPDMASNSQQGCNFTKNTCTDAPIDYPDMIENYMDYSAETCMNMFSLDQIEIMRSMLLGPRSSLLEGQEFSAPSADFEVVQTVIYVGDEVQFVDLSTGGVAEYFWTFGDGVTSTESNPTHVYTEAGVYTVTLNVTNPVGSDFELKELYLEVLNPVGINENTLVDNISIHPNPASTLVNIGINASFTKAAYQLYNSTGKLVAQNNLDQAATIDVSELAAGLYFMQLNIDGIIVNKKFVVE